MRIRHTRAQLAALLPLLLWAAVPASAAPPGAPQSAASVPPRTAQPAGRPYSTLVKTARFGTVNVYLPDGTPKSVAVFISGDGGWELGVIKMAQALTAMGAVVIGADVHQYLVSLSKAALRPGAPCQNLAVDFEALSHQVQKEIGLREYHVPVLVGYSSGATMVYAALVQSPPGTFAGALSLGFCADQDFAGAALCPGAGPGLHYSPNKEHELVLEPAAGLKQPWIVLQGQKDQVCPPHAVDAFAAHIGSAEVVQLPLVGHGFSVERNWMPQFRAAFARLAAAPATAVAAPPAEIGDLPVQEVHASGSGEEFALLITGDGGWAGLDQELAAQLATNGVPTVALNSLKYFWSERSPEQTASDVARLLRHYLAAWDKHRVLLVGYSFGADVLPFVINRLPADLRSHIASVSLIGLDANASFEVSVAGWVGAEGSGPPTRPEVAALAHLPVLCIYGEGETDTICPSLGDAVTREQIGKGHHFSGEYAAIADRILAFTRAARAGT